MTLRNADRRIELPLPRDITGDSRVALLSYARRLNRSFDHGSGQVSTEAIQRERDLFLDEVTNARPDDHTWLEAAGLVITDLALQGWTLRVGTRRLEVVRPVGAKDNPLLEKARIRRQELVRRDEQLAQPSVRRFIQSMETQRLHAGRFVSIFTLMRDGRELAAGLRRAIEEESASERLDRIDALIDPYIQFAMGDDRCEYTGLRLADIWRYFRHTWSTQHASVPGRTMAFIVRDRAAPTHPVIGIGALSSPVIQLRTRDVAIGWHPDVILSDLQTDSGADALTWLLGLVDGGLQELYVLDLLEDDVLSVSDIRDPNRSVIQRLRDECREQRERHHRFARSQDLKRRDTKESPRLDLWERRARTALFRSKRAAMLADLLEARLILSSHSSDARQGDGVRALLSDPAGNRMIRRLVRKAKADRIGAAVADLSVCGAVPPYNALLGGKLVSVLAVSPEVVCHYRDHYAHSESEIASSMAGRAIIRPSFLAYVGTTSLYSSGSSQYNRIKVPCDVIGGLTDEVMSFDRLGYTESFGTSHYSARTVQALVKLIEQSTGGMRVNSIFGEGASPKLRKVRDGLDLLGFPATELLQHGRRRIVYGVRLVRNLRAFLLGRADDPDYLFSLTEPETATQRIARWWKHRWLFKRVQLDGVLAEVERHTLVRPIQHGARVVLPDPPPEQLTLLDDL